MTPDQIRQSFLDFFKDRSHTVVESSPVVPQGDPTLLFTNAGMNQFKDVFLGNEVRDYKRATSAQKCVRAGGKHNDLDEVGKDGRHLTFFEMLGNWSFGDYYKRDSIIWAWDYLLNILKLEKDRLYVTVYKDDEESYDIWHKEIGLSPERILHLGDITKGDEENFWSMGPTGPCGPCTEIHYDLHPEMGPLEFVEGYDDDRVNEIWNLVFMEFNRDETGELHPLPMKSVDTGLGLDRTAMVMAGVDNVFHTELFSGIFKKTLSLLDENIPENLTDFYRRDDFTDFAVIADHIRTVTFSICDGAKFSNEGRGYVLRRILRRAVRHGRNIGFNTPFLYDVAQAVIADYGHIYPELKATGNEAAELIKLEEERFFRNIDRGMELFEDAAQRTADENRSQLSGDEVFQLHATFGFPPDLTEIMAQERGLGIDWQDYEKLWKQHQEASKGKDTYADAAGLGDWITVHDAPTDSFVGYHDLAIETFIRKYRPLSDGRYELLLIETPFYAESGGQVGDCGIIESLDKSIAFEVITTQKAPIGLVHTAKLIQGSITSGAVKEKFNARVDVNKRRLTASNHTATHLLHAALRNIVSDSIFQAGSQVGPDKLRFDFSHSKPLTDDEIAQIEDQINTQIHANIPVQIHVDVSRDDAVNNMGAMAIFGEKYGDKVRVIQIGTDSVELCGGTHVTNTGHIHLFRITSESGVAAGIRRIEAVTNHPAYTLMQHDRQLIATLAQALKSDTHNILARANSLISERSELEQQVDKLSQKLAQSDARDFASQASDINGIKVISKAINVDTRDQLLAYADKLRQQFTGQPAAVLLGAILDGKAALVCVVTDEAFKGRKIKAGDLINKVSTYVDGRGGGRPTLAQAGGTNIDGLPQAIAAFENAVAS